MPVDINGYVLSESSGLKLGASNSKIMASQYGIIDPMLPGMAGSATAGGAYKCYPFPVNDVNLNIGSPWNTSTFKFTAPVAGIYYTSYSGICGDGNAANTSQYNGVIINGGNACFSYRDTVATWELHHIEVLLKLAAGDYVSWSFNTAPGPTNASSGGAYQANHNTCTIWLVG